MVKITPDGDKINIEFDCGVEFLYKNTDGFSGIRIPKSALPEALASCNRAAGSPMILKDSAVGYAQDALSDLCSDIVETSYDYAYRTADVALEDIKRQIMEWQAQADGRKEAQA